MFEMLKDTNIMNLKKKTNMISILIPSRNLIFSKVIESVAELMRDFGNTRLHVSYDLPIPDSHNYLVEQGLKDNPSHLLFVEEDTIPPKGVLGKMLELNKDIVFADYGVNGYSCSAKTKSGEILWAGLGCACIKREVFDKLEKPWFRTDKTLRLNDWKWLDKPMKYGGHDIWFYTQAKKAGFTIGQIEEECEHLQLDALGVKEYNNGFHTISEKPKIKNYQILERGDLL